jgi:hypothetical protein
MIVAFLFVGMFASACRAPAPGSQTQKDATTSIQVFEDANRNGKWDSGEPALPDVLIAARSNIHGTMTYEAQITDTDGRTTISTTYTHFFDLLAFPPCGYESTTENSVRAKRRNVFGFAPVNPQTGIADLYILLWHDENQDGEYQTNEMPLAGEMLYIDPGLPWEYDADIPLGQLMTQTDSGGEAVANLGNTCGEVKITIPNGWHLPNTEDEQHYQTTYQPGRTNFFLGVVPDE